MFWSTNQLQRRFNLVWSSKARQVSAKCDSIIKRCYFPKDTDVTHNPLWNIADMFWSGVWDVHQKCAFLWDDPKKDHWPKITWITVHQRNRWINSANPSVVKFGTAALLELFFLRVCQRSSPHQGSVLVAKCVLLNPEHSFNMVLEQWSSQLACFSYKLQSLQLNMEEFACVNAVMLFDQGNLACFPQMHSDKDLKRNECMIVQALFIVHKAKPSRLLAQCRVASASPYGASSFKLFAFYYTQSRVRD